MVDTLVSGASAARHAGSSPVLGTKATPHSLIITDEVAGFFIFICSVTSSDTI